MRLPAFFLAAALCLLATARLPAQDPAAQQDAEAAREKLLKAADELDNIQANSESTKLSVDGMKTDVATLQADVTQLQTDNAALKQELADVQADLAKSEASRLKDRQTLIDNVADMIAAGKAHQPPATKRKKEPDSEADSIPPGLSPPPDANSGPSTTSRDAGSTADDSPPPKSQKGYYHVVASGETLTLICAAYRDHGVNVTVSQIRKANDLTGKSVLKVGQKLFIPKPGA